MNGEDGAAAGGEIVVTETDGTQSFQINVVDATHITITILSRIYVSYENTSKVYTSTSFGII